MMPFTHDSGIKKTPCPFVNCLQDCCPCHSIMHFFDMKHISFLFKACIVVPLFLRIKESPKFAEQSGKIQQILLTIIIVYINTRILQTSIGTLSTNAVKNQLNVTKDKSILKQQILIVQLCNILEPWMKVSSRVNQTLRCLL